MIPLNSGRYLVQSVPGEMSLDQLSVLDQAEKHRGLVTGDSLVTNLRWDQQRSLLVLGEHIRSLSALSSNSSSCQSGWWGPVSCGSTVRQRGERVSTGCPASSAQTSELSFL